MVDFWTLNNEIPVSKYQFQNRCVRNWSVFGTTCLCGIVQIHLSLSSEHLAGSSCPFDVSDAAWAPLASDWRLGVPFLQKHSGLVTENQRLLVFSHITPQLVKIKLGSTPESVVVRACNSSTWRPGKQSPASLRPAWSSKLLQISIC